MPSSVSALLALEIRRILHDVDLRRDLLVELWSMHRDRRPMAEAAFSRWKTLRAQQLDALEPEVVVVVDGFYAALEDFLAYVGSTEDMPLHLDHHWRHFEQQMVLAADDALDRLEPAPEATVPVVDRDGRNFLEAFALRKKIPTRIPREVLQGEE